jgi:hypothetical protein
MVVRLSGLVVGCHSCQVVVVVRLSWLSVFGFRLSRSVADVAQSLSRFVRLSRLQAITEVAQSLSSLKSLRSLKSVIWIFEQEIAYYCQTFSNRIS